MPLVDTIAGVSIRIRTREPHPTPHVHAEYGDYYASIAISTTWIVLEGEVHPRKLKILKKELTKPEKVKFLQQKWHEYHPDKPQI